jgi:hypothetical protein
MTGFAGGFIFQGEFARKSILTSARFLIVT